MATVESLDEEEKFLESIAVIKLGINFVELIEDSKEDADNVWENSNTKKQNCCTQEPFRVTSRIVVSKADSREGGEGEVANYNYLLSVGSLNHWIKAHKMMINMHI